LQAPAQATEESLPDPELALYQGFVSSPDRAQLAGFRSASEPGARIHFDDPRLAELAWRWRHAEADPADPHWRELLLHRFEHGFGRRPGWQQWRAELEATSAQETVPERQQLLRELADWGAAAAMRLGGRWQTGT
jgi:exonuclease I